MPRIKAGARVLLADDHAINRRLVLKQLEKIGCDVCAVNDGKQAVEAALGERFDVVLMDCRMPLMDGFAATKRIREAEGLSGVRVPIVAITANARPEDRAACLAAGMDDCIAKPIAREVLERVLERWIADAPAFPAATLNLVRIKAIFQDDEAGVRELLDASAEVLAEDVSLLVRAIDRGDTLAAGDAAHALKGACANIGAERLALQAEALEREIEGSYRLSEMRLLLRALENEGTALQAEIRSYVRDSHTG